MDDRERAVLCYRSQFQPRQLNPAEEAKGIVIASEYFLESLRGRLRYFGSLIGAPFGEAYTSDTPLPVQDPVSHFQEAPWRAR